MLNRALMEKMNRYQRIYTELYAALRWKADKQSLMLVAAMYATSKKEFHLQSFVELAAFIKNEVGLFSQLKSATRYTTAATLDTQTQDPKEGFRQLINIYNKLVENGFSRTVYTYIAAGALLKVEPSRMKEYVEKAILVYHGMKEHHFFLTGPTDYPLAAIFALSKKHSKEIVFNIEEYYHHLHDAGFSKGNDLQFLSHILALDPESKPAIKAEQCIMVKKMLSIVNIKTQRSYYPYIGMLTYIENPEIHIKSLYEINEKLNQEKLFRWNKDVNFMISVLFLLNEISLLGDAAQTSINTSIEILVQAQQAAVAASITAATVAASSSANS